MFRGDVLGVLAVFCRDGIGPDRFEQLRGFAAQAAVAIANARAFAQLEQLRAQLQLERDYLREEVRDARAHGAIVGSSPASLTEVGIRGPRPRGHALPAAVPRSGYGNTQGTTWRL